MSADAQLDQTLQRALEPFQARVAASGGAIAVAYSGGLDSAALLHLAASYANRNASTRVIALHVHHGLLPQADSWLVHCRAQAEALSVTFDARQIALKTAGDGIEAAARKARYAALGEMCRAHGASVLLTAHHLDD
ncbi:MAG: tRNA(Ile)-lysidine synthetase, partial [Pseudomonadota bacterium]|nr:tRNA(Ile)-lysidine synthetase [Pseudomonadota bacterium]